MNGLKAYLAVILTVLSILLLACWNPQWVQNRKNGKPDGTPNLLLISLIGLLVGVLAVWLIDMGNGERYYPHRREREAMGSYF